MKLEYISKSLEYDAQGLPYRLKVVLGHGEGAFVPVYLSHGIADLSNQELFERAMQSVYEENFPNRAENEKFREFSVEIAEARAEIAKLKDDALAEIRSEIQHTREMVKVVTLTLNAVLDQIDTEDGESEAVNETEDDDTTVADMDDTQE